MIESPRIEVIKVNVTKVYLNNHTVLYSYNTPVACYEYSTKKYYRTDLFHSVTTSKHINQWLNGKDAELKPQSFFGTLD